MMNSTIVKVNPLIKSRKVNKFPFSDLDSWINNILDEKGAFNLFESNKNIPKTNIYNDEKFLKIELAVPGMQKSEIQIKVKDQILQVSGQKKNNPELKEIEPMSREFSLNQFERNFQLPKEIDLEKIEAKCEHGILMIKLSKLEENKLVKSVVIE